MSIGTTCNVVMWSKLAHLMDMMVSASLNRHVVYLAKYASRIDKFKISLSFGDSEFMPEAKF